MLVHRRPRLLQPRTGAAIDWSNPINKGLVEAYNWGAGKVDLVGNRVALTDYAVINAAGAAGVAATFSAEKHVITGYPWSGATQWTFLTLALPDTSKTAAISFANGAGSDGQSYLLFNTNASFGAAPGYFGFASGNSPGSTSIIAVASGIVADPAVYVGVQSLTGRSIYRNGALLTSDALTRTIAGTVSVTCFNGIQGYTGYNSTGSKYFMSMIWNRALSQAEVAYIGANPWKLLSPRRIYIPTYAAAAGGAPTLSDLKAVSITSSTVQATYDYAF